MVTVVSGSDSGDSGDSSVTVATVLCESGEAVLVVSF
jgi:hypothetical protein